MPARAAHGFIALVHHTSSVETFINPNSIVHVGQWEAGKQQGAVLRLADASTFRTDKSVGEVLNLIARTTSAKAGQRETSNG